MSYSKKTKYVSSFAKLPVGIPSENVYKVLDIGLVINEETGIIENASVTLLTEVATEFLKEMIIGFNVKDDDINELLQEIRERYHGSAQKAIITTLKKVIEKYKNIQ